MLIDDHALLRAALRAMLGSVEGLRVAGEAGSAEEALLRLGGAAEPPRLAILGVRLPGIDGIEALAQLREHAPAMRFLILSMIEDPRVVRRAFAAGADGYVPKSASSADLVRAIRDVCAGVRHVHPALEEGLARRPSAPLDRLDDREQEVARLLALGHTNAEAGERLGVGPRGVERIRAAALDKLGVRTRAELVRVMMDEGLFPPPG